MRGVRVEGVGGVKEVVAVGGVIVVEWVGSGGGEWGGGKWEG